MNTPNQEQSGPSIACRGELLHYTIYTTISNIIKSVKGYSYEFLNWAFGWVEKIVKSVYGNMNLS